MLQKWRKILKMFLLGASIAAVNIIAFSKAFCGISIHSDNIFAVTCSIFIPVMSIIIFISVGYAILNAKEESYTLKLEELNNPAACEEALRKYIKKFPFLSAELKNLINQVERMEAKKAALILYLKQSNREYKDLVQESNAAEQFLIENVKRVLGKCVIIGALDRDEEDSRNIYQEQIGEFHAIIDCNEQNLDEFDVFLEEVSKMGEKPLRENESLKSTISAMRQIRGVGSLTFEKENIT